MFDVNPSDSTLTVNVDRNFQLDLGTGADTTDGMPAGHLVFKPSDTTRWKTTIKSGSGAKTSALLQGLLNAHWDPTRGISFQW